MAKNPEPRNKFLEIMDARVKRRARGSYGFALGLYQSFAAQNPARNVFFSPFCISHCLAGLREGARGDTSKQIEKTLKLKNSTENKYDISFFDEAMQLMATSNRWDPPWTPPFRMLVASRMCIPKDYHVCWKYIWYNTDFKPINVTQPILLRIDYSKKSKEEILAEINACVASYTDSKIRHSVPLSFIPENPKLIFISAVYFKGHWVKQFDEKDTYDGQFRRRKDDSTTTPMMRMTAKLPFSKYSKLRCKITYLNYTGNQLSMYIILPDDTEGLADLEAQMTSSTLNWIANRTRWTFSEVQMELELPKFELEMGMPITEVLRSLGITDLFSPEACDLSGLQTDKEEPEGDLYVSGMYHSARLDFHEEISNHYLTRNELHLLSTSADVSNETESFKADHPFMFFIFDNFSKHIIFMGRFTGPEPQSSF